MSQDNLVACTSILYIHLINQNKQKKNIKRLIKIFFVIARIAVIILSVDNLMFSRKKKKIYLFLCELFFFLVNSVVS